ncbi:TetR/AcrR family transcriptional regulator [Allorhizocola rhizosphaerae]|uniref:TetR/AcrR family transcriptional regulator n=1 Tax=Allorhizocola rhizosphaerae TaxID=1872709 RepID=UPI001B8C88DF|nr:TetR/AcrR family transcriptional regulator [Allorhizocola rhizosphaerae]
MARDQLLDKVVTYAAEQGIAGKSLREIASGVGTSHRMLIYHFGSHEGLMTAIVGAVEAQQRAVLAELARDARSPRELMAALWAEVSSPEVRPFVRLFFEVFGLAVQGAPGTQAMLENLTEPWLTAGVAAAARIGAPTDAAAIRLGVAVTRGLLLELLAGADPAEIEASHRLFIQFFERYQAG